MKELLILETVRKDLVWGSEFWTVSAHPHGDCIVKSGTYRGWHLSELWNDHRELFGNYEGDKFPLLVKVIDAKKDLSVQVHPDDDYADKYENGSLGKAECWFIMNATDGGTLMLGHNASSREEAASMIEEGRWDDFLKAVPIKCGNFVQINPGTIHAIRGGTVLTEIQQSSDVTYRLYDYDRMVNGRKRELHIDKSLDVIRIPDNSMENFHDEFPRDGHKTPYYNIIRVNSENEAVISATDRFVIVSVTNGEGAIDGEKIGRGDSLIVPAGYGDAVIHGRMELLLTRI